MDNATHHLFDPHNLDQCLLGATIYNGSPRLAELAAKSGFDVVWIEMEHGPTSFDQAEQMCMATELGGAIPLVRVPDDQRHHILHALEIGAHIVVVPMVNSSDQARRVVEYGKFPPLGKRGFSTRSRGVGYGLDAVTKIFEQANERTHLFVQIETLQATENLDAICETEGITGILIGPGDLSASMDMTGQVNDASLIRLVCDCIVRAKSAGKQVGILVAPGSLLDAAIEAGCNVVICGGDVMDLSKAWLNLLSTMRSKVQS